MMEAERYISAAMMNANMGLTLSRLFRLISRADDDIGGIFRQPHKSRVQQEHFDTLKQPAVTRCSNAGRASIYYATPRPTAVPILITHAKKHFDATPAFSPIHSFSPTSIYSRDYCRQKDALEYADIIH